MTNDLISRSELLKKSIGVSEFDDGWERVLRAVPVLDIEMAEAVDAVPVVRCRDCKRVKMFFDGQKQREFGFCNAFKCWVDDDGFCNHGAKRDREGDKP